MNKQAELGAFLRRELRPTRYEYNVVAVAMNEYLSDIGVGQFVPYVERSEPSGTSLCPTWHRSVEPATWCNAPSRQRMKWDARRLPM